MQVGEKLGVPFLVVKEDEGTARAGSWAGSGYQKTSCRCSSSNIRSCSCKPEKDDDPDPLQKEENNPGPAKQRRSAWGPKGVRFQSSESMSQVSNARTVQVQRTGAVESRVGEDQVVKSCAVRECVKE